MMTLENAIKTLDDVIPPHTHNTVDREHMPIVLAWESVKNELENRVPVVRCGECKHSWQDIGGLCCSHGVCVDCTVPEYFFCACGEMRTDFVDDNKIGERRTDANEPDGT